MSVLRLVTAQLCALLLANLTPASSSSIPALSEAGPARVGATFEVLAPSGFDPADPERLLQLRAFPLRRLPSMDHGNFPLEEARWIKLVLAGTREEAQQWLRILASQQRRIEAYLLIEGGLAASARAGFEVPRWDRPLPVDQLALDLSNWRRGTAEVFVRAVASQHAALAPAIQTSQQLLEEHNGVQSLTYFYFGTIAFLLLFRAVLYLHFRDAASRDYMLFAIGMAVAIAARTGIVDEQWGHQLGGFHLGDWRIELKALNTILGLRCLDSYFNLRRSIPWASRAIRLTTLGAIALMAVSPWTSPDGFNSAVTGLQLAGVSLVLGTCAAAVRAKLTGARLTAMAWSLIVLGTAWSNFMTMGLLPLSPAMSFAGVFAIMWEMFFNTIGLTYRFAKIAEAESQRQLKAAEANGLSRLIKVLSHDISAPVSIISFSIEWLRRDIGRGVTRDLDGRLARVQAAATSITEMLRSVRQFELLRMHEGKLPVAATSVTTSMREAVELISQQVQAKNLRLTMPRLEPDLIVWADPQFLRGTILANALSNAVKFSPDGGAIELGAKRVQSEVLITVRDHGIGIPLRMQRDFKAGVPLHSRPGTRDEVGTGFGVQLMRDFARGMGGDLRIDSWSREDGAGATGTLVTIVLRAAHGPDREERHGAAPAPAVQIPVERD